MSFAGYFKLTGMHSHRHPFLGIGDEVATAQSAVATSSTPPTTEDNSALKIGKPFIGGLAVGLITYTVSKAFDIEKKKAFRLAFTLGGLEVASLIVGAYLNREIAALAELEKKSE